MATSPNATQITPPRVSLIDERTGAVSREWYRWFYSLYNIVGSGAGIIPVASGGTGLSTIPTNGQLLIGNGTGYTLNTLGVGVGISVTNGIGTIVVANTGVLSNIAGTGISVSSATGNVTIANTGVLSFTGGTTGLTPATATTGAITLAGTLGIANGGTNGSATPTTYGIAYGTGTAYAFTAAGTTGQVLTATTGGAPTWAAPATSGTVTSVGLSLPAQFTVTNSPVTSSGTLTGAWNTQTANYVLAGPTTGAAAVPTFRALVAADIPALPYGTGTVTSVSVVSANGFAGTVATATTTPAITLTTSITGVLKGNGTAISAAVVNTDYFAPSAPVTKTADFTVADTEVWLINNKSGSTCTVTLPTASSWSGRVLRFQNYQVQAVVSASSNVVPLTGGAAGTSILLASSGDAATLVSDGSNWLMTQYIPNNILLLE
jgi:hypothetical protein